MIKSILDTDLYKFSTSYAYFKLYPKAEGEFVFNDRNQEKWSKEDQKIFYSRFEESIKWLSVYRLTQNEKEWCIKNIPYIPQNYWEWLATFSFDPKKMKYRFDENGVFQCSVIDKLYKVTLYEIAVLSLYSEIRNYLLEDKNNEWPHSNEIINRLKAKIDFANTHGIPFSEFGTRRRYSGAFHEGIVETLKNESKTCVGTSNVYLAMTYGMKPIGTFPHEWVMFHGATFGYKRANFLSLEDWIDVYQGNLGTALIDTYTTDSFLNTLTKKQAHLLSGFRQDSGDEIVVGEKILAKLESLGIDTKSKVIVFSNALDFEKAGRIYEHFKEKCKVSFGIGTNLTNDTSVSWKPANIVMKLMKCRLDENSDWENCIKISDDTGKHMGDNMEFDIASKELKLNI